MSKKTNSYNSIVNSLIQRVRMSDQSAFEELLALYNPLINSLISRFNSESVNAQDMEDVRQELIVVFYNSILSYDIEQKEVSFGLYSKICMNNALVTQLKDFQKRRENFFVLLQNSEVDINTTEDSSGLENTVIAQESLKELNQKVEALLSVFEKKVWYMYVSGLNTAEIAKSADKSEKSVNNAIFRIRRKLKKYFTK